MSDDARDGVDFDVEPIDFDDNIRPEDRDLRVYSLVDLNTSDKKSNLAGRDPRADMKALQRKTEAELERIRRDRYDSPVPDTPPAQRSWRFPIVLALSFIGFLTPVLIGGYYLYGSRFFQEQSATKPAPAPLPVAQNQTATPAGPSQSPNTVPNPSVMSTNSNGTSPLAKSLFDLGGLSCVARANQISNFLSNGSEAIILQKPVGHPDKSLLMATMLPMTAGPSQDVSIVSLAPNQANGCEGNYQSIRVIEKPCPNALADMFGGAKALTSGTSGISIVPLNQLGRVFAIPAGNACVMIKQELVQ